MRGLCDSLSEYPIILKKLLRNFTNLVQLRAAISQCRCKGAEEINDLSALLISSSIALMLI